MLNKTQMSLQEFQTWKEANNFLFDYFKELQSSLDEQVAVYAKNVLICDNQHLENVRLQTAALAGQASLLQDLIDMDYSDIVEEEECS